MSHVYCICQLFPIMEMQAASIISPYFDSNWSLDKISKVVVQFGILFLI